MKRSWFRIAVHMIYPVAAVSLLLYLIGQIAGDLF